MAVPAVLCLFMLTGLYERPTGFQVPQHGGFAYALSQPLVYQRASTEGRLTGIIWTAGCAALMGASDTRSATATPIPRAAAARMRERLFMILFSIMWLPVPPARLRYVTEPGGVCSLER